MSAADAARKKGSKPLALAVVAALCLAAIASSSKARAQIVLGEELETFAVLGAEGVTNTGEPKLSGETSAPTQTPRSPGSMILWKMMGRAW